VSRTSATWRALNQLAPSTQQGSKVMLQRWCSVTRQRRLGRRSRWSAGPIGVVPSSRMVLVCFMVIL
jgi:hypothetical protein